jgi:hypothetical protein
MLKLTTKNNKLVLLNDNGASVEFELFDKKLFKVIEANIAELKKNLIKDDWEDNECFVSIEKKKENRSYLVLCLQTYHKTRMESREKFIKMIISENVSYEISSRMILLNKLLKVPKQIIE